MANQTEVGVLAKFRQEGAEALDKTATGLKQIKDEAEKTGPKIADVSKELSATASNADKARARFDELKTGLAAAGFQLTATQEQVLQSGKKNQEQQLSLIRTWKETGQLARTTTSDMVKGADDAAHAIDAAATATSGWKTQLGQIGGVVRAAVAEFGVLGTARNALNGLAEGAGLTFAALGPLNSALAVTGAFFGAYGLTRGILEFVGVAQQLDKAVGDAADKLNSHGYAAAASAAKQDTMNRAFREGAPAGISYGDAIKYIGNMEAIRIASFSSSLELQKRRITAELELGRITQEQANSMRAQISIQEQVNQVAINRVPIETARTLAIRKYNDEIKATGETEAKLLDLLKNSPATFQLYAQQVGLSGTTVGMLRDKLEAQTKAHKAAEEAAKAQAKALDETLKRMERFEQINAKGAKAAVLGPQTVLRDMGVAMGDIQIGGEKQIGTGFLALLPDLSDRAKKHMSDLKLETKSFSDVLDGTFKKLPNLLTAAFAGGGNAKGAIKGFATQLGAGLFGGEGSSAGPLAGITKSLSGGVSKLASGFLGSTAGKLIGGIAGSLLPGVGGLAVSGISALVGHFQNKEYGDVKNQRAQFEQEAGGTDALIQKAIAAGPAAEAALKKVWDAKKVADYNAAIKNLNTVLGQHQAELDRAAAILDKYAIKWYELGDEKKQQHVADSTKGLLQDFSDLQKAGLGNVEILGHMQGEFSQLYQDIIKAGGDAPASLQEIFQPLIEMGLLVDEDGKKITDLSKVKFGNLGTAAQKAAKDAAAALDGLSKTQVQPIKIPYRFEGQNELPTGDAAPPAPEPEQYAAKGIFANRPTLAMFGEGKEPELGGPVGFMSKALAGALEQAGGVAGGGGQGDAPLVLNFNVTAIDASSFRETVEREILPMISDTVQSNRRGQRTKLRAALGVTK